MAPIAARFTLVIILDMTASEGLNTSHLAEAVGCSKRAIIRMRCRGLSCDHTLMQGLENYCLLNQVAPGLRGLEGCNLGATGGLVGACGSTRPYSSGAGPPRVPDRGSSARL